MYDEIGDSPPPGAAAAPGAAGRQRRHRGERLFEVVDVTQYDWEITYDADGYIDLLDTFSGHIDMTDPQRELLYGEIRRRLARRADGSRGGTGAWHSTWPAAERPDAGPPKTAYGRRNGCGPCRDGPTVANRGGDLGDPERGGG